MPEEEFQEIARSGGLITLDFDISEGGTSYSHRVRVVGQAAVMTGIYAISPGIAVGHFNLANSAASPPPFPNAIAVPLLSDSRGKFGHFCPKCESYWRGEAHVFFCPYCRLSEDSFNFLSESQLSYVEHYCQLFNLSLGKKGQFSVDINLDEIAEQVRQGHPPPEFYKAEQSQQNQFRCVACDSFNDILGRYGYCSVCGTTNNFQEFSEKTIPAIREDLNGNRRTESCLRDAVSEFDSFVASVAKQLSINIPLSKSRINRLTKFGFHDIEETHEILYQWFDIHLRKKISDTEWSTIRTKFRRRHVHEHQGGVVDQKYIDETQDHSVRVGQQIYETREEIHQLLGSLVKVARNINRGFHCLLPPDSETIDSYNEKLARIEAANKSPY